MPRGTVILALAIACWVLVVTPIMLIAAAVQCPTEDSSNCYWNASKQGNGQGRSFIDIAGHVIYLP